MTFTHDLRQKVILYYLTGQQAEGLGSTPASHEFQTVFYGGYLIPKIFSVDLRPTFQKCVAYWLKTINRVCQNLCPIVQDREKLSLDMQTFDMTLIVHWTSTFFIRKIQKQLKIGFKLQQN